MCCHAWTARQKANFGSMQTTNTLKAAAYFVSEAESEHLRCGLVTWQAQTAMVVRSRAGFSVYKNTAFIYSTNI